MSGTRAANGGLLARQVRHELTSSRRQPIVLILSVGFPTIFFVLVAAVVGNETIDARAGIRVAQFLAPAFASFGVVMASFSFLAIGLAEARTLGVLKRQNGTPLPRWALLGGRMGAALVLSFAATAIIVGIGVALYDVQLIVRTLPAVISTIVIAALSFSALGLAVAALAKNQQMAQALTNGVVIPIAFVSDIFTFGGTIPSWMTTLGWIFPLKHLVNALGDAFNPYLEGTGFAWDHLAVIVAWGLAGALVAGWRLRAEPERSTAPGRRPSRRQVTADARPRRTARPGAVVLLRDQMAHTNAILWRDAGSVFFAVAFPVLLVVIIPAMNGGGDLTLPNGQQLAGFYAATMAIYGAGVTAYINMPETLATARESGVLKRSRGAPAPAWVLLGGRVAGALVVSVLTLVAIYLVAGALYGTPVPQAWAATLLTFLLAATCFAVLGLMIVALVSEGQSVVGVALGTYLPLCFVSDVFVIGVDLPRLLDTVSWIFPLRHATRAMTLVVAPDEVAGSGLQPEHLAALLAWTAVGLLVVAWRFRWETREKVGRVSRKAAAPADA